MDFDNKLPAQLCLMTLYVSVNVHAVTDHKKENSMSKLLERVRQKSMATSIWCIFQRQHSLNLDCYLYIYDLCTSSPAVVQRNKD